jgi:DNA-binding protein HU-beta
LIDATAKKTGLTKIDTTKTLTAIMETIEETLVQGDNVSLIGFGTFYVKSRAARDGRNPQTGAPIRIPAKKVPGFRPGKGLKEAVEQSGE